MKEIKIFEPAMCCETGLCGVGVDPELLRVSTLINSLKGKNIIVKRYNLSGTPQAFIDHKEINEYINKYGVENLPVTEVDGRIAVVGRYPSHEEFERWLGMSPVLNKQKKSGCCEGGCCQ